MTRERGGGAADDGVVHDDNAFAADHFVNEVEFDADAEVADELAGLEEGAADVVVADEGVAVGDAAGFGVAHRGPVAGVGDRNNEVGGDGMFAGERAAEVGADLGDVAAHDVAVGPGKVHVLEDAESVRLLRAGPGVDGVEAVLVDEDDFAGGDVADELGLDEVEGAGLTGEDVGNVVGAAFDAGNGEFAEDEWSETVRIAYADEFVFAHDDERVGALDAFHHVFERMHAVTIIWVDKEVQDDLAVAGGLENGAARFEFIAETGGVGEVAVVADGDLAAGAIHDERLGVLDGGTARGRVADVAKGKVAGQGAEDVLVEHLRNEAHALVGAQVNAVGRRDAGAFLAAMLERVQAVIRQFGGIRVAVDAEQTAVMSRLSVVVRIPHGVFSKRSPAK